MKLMSSSRFKDKKCGEFINMKLITISSHESAVNTTNLKSTSVI